MIKTLECTITLQNGMSLLIKVKYNSGREHGNKLVLEVIEMLQAIWVEEVEYSNIEFGISSSFEIPNPQLSVVSTGVIAPQPLAYQALLSNVVS